MRIFYKFIMVKIISSKFDQYSEKEFLFSFFLGFSLENMKINLVEKV